MSSQVGIGREIQVPNDWRLSTIETHIEDIGDGGTPDTSVDRYFGGNINWAVVDDVDFRISKTKRHLTEEGLENSSAKLWPKNSVIVTTGATIGKVGITELPTATKQGITGIVPNEDLSPDFLAYYLLSERKTLQRYAQGGTFEEIRPYILKRLRVPLPPLSEQHRIADILSTVDKQIQQTNEIIEETKSLKLGLVQDLLTEGIGHDKFKEIRVGTKKIQIPTVWEHLTVNDLINKGIIEEIKDGNHGNLHPKSEDFVPDGVPFLTSDVVQDHRIYWENSKKITQNTADNLRKGKARAGDLILTHKGSVGRVNIIPESKDLVVLSPQVTYYRTSEQINTEFLAHQFRSYIFQNQLKIRSKQSTRDYISLTKQKNLEVFLPPFDEQEKIAGYLSVFDKKIRQEEDHKQMLKEIKRGLMQDLLTGKVRVNTD